MKKIGILCAGDTELEPFLAHIKDAKITETAMLRCYEGTIRDVRVAALYSGVCKVNAAAAAQILISIFHTDIIVNAGTAGGMDKSVQLFDTVISEQTAYHDVADDILTEFHPWLDTVYFHSDPRLLKAARKQAGQPGYPVCFGTTVTGEQFISDEGREAINRKFAPLSVDMETAAIAHVCHVNQIPFIAVRTITDTPDHAGIENFDRNCEKASAISAAIVLRLLPDFASV